MAKFCKKCGKPVAETDRFCKECGANLGPEDLSQATPFEKDIVTSATIARPPEKKKGKGCLIAILVVVVIGVVGVILGSGDTENKTPSNVIIDSIGVSEEEATVIHDILQECGVVNVSELTHDEMLDGAHKENETGYRIDAEGAENVILYLNEDYTVNIVRWNDEDLYKDGAVITTIEEIKNRPDLEVLSTSGESDGYVRYAVGEIRNNTTKTYSYVQVEIGIYQGETLVGSTLDNVNNLEPGQTWHFRAPILEDNADSFRVTGVTGF